jgi:hypothetical protein
MQSIFRFEMLSCDFAYVNRLIVFMVHYQKSHLQFGGGFSISYSLVHHIRVGSVGTGTGYMGWTFGVRFPVEARDFLYHTESRSTLWSTQLHNQWAPRALSPGVKRQGCEAHYSHPFNVEVKNGAANFPSPIRLYGMVVN